MKKLTEVKFHTVKWTCIISFYNLFFFFNKEENTKHLFWNNCNHTPIIRHSLAVLAKMILKFLSSSGVLSILGVTSSRRLISNSWNLTEPLAFPNSPPSYISLLDRASRISHATSTTPKVPPVLVMLLKKYHKLNTLIYSFSISPNYSFMIEYYDVEWSSIYINVMI